MRKSLITLKIFTLSLGIMVLNRFSVVEQRSRKMFWTNVLISGQGQEASRCGYGKAHTQWQRRHAEWCLVGKIKYAACMYSIKLAQWHILIVFWSQRIMKLLLQDVKFDTRNNESLLYIVGVLILVWVGSVSNEQKRVSEFQWLGLSSSAHLWRLLSGTRVEALAKRC